MDELIELQLKRLRQARKRRVRWVSAFLVLALVVTFVTTNALTLPSEARVYTERVLACDFVPHSHQADCYNEAGELICGQADYVLHSHNADCYDYYGNLVCPLPELVEHSHSEACYEERLVLVCDEDTTGHVHSDACYEYPEETFLQEDGEEFIVRAEEPVLICGMEEGEGAHVHTEDCWELQRQLNCGLAVLERHSHTEDCYNEAGELICGKLEVGTHIHGSHCLETVELSREEVELRGLAEGEAAESAPAWNLTGDWSEDLLAVASSQLGYHEQEDDLGLGADGVERPYTIYGEWYGDPYCAWNAAFVSWCLNGAEVPAGRFARHNDPAAWQLELVQAKNWFDPFADAPLPGDLVFLCLEETEDEQTTADHVAVVTGFGVEQSGTLVLRVIEAAEGEVRESAYAAGDERVLGFARLPGEDEDPDYPAQGFEALCGEMRVTVRAESGAFPKGTTMRVIPVETEEILEAVSGAVAAEGSSAQRVQAVDIAFFNEAGEEIEPLKPIRVTMAAEELRQAAEPVVVHVDAAGEAQVMETKVAAQLDEAPAEDEIVFDAGAFSVYALVYTVDFRYDVNGKEFAYSLSGGDGIPFSVLAELLGIAADDPTTEEDELWQFVSDVKSVAFSDPSLLWVGPVPENMTLGALKESAGLSCAYSDELTEEQIDAMNAAQLQAGDWALVSLAPFATHETLTVTMTDGEVFTVEVTDAQQIPDAEAVTIDVNKSYLICYEVTDGTETTYYLLKNDGTVDSNYHPDFEGDTDAEHDFEHLNSTYCWTFNHIFKEKDIEHNLEKNYFLIRPIDHKTRTLSLNDLGEPLVQQSNNNVALVQNGDGFIMEGYHNIGPDDEPRYVRLGFVDGSFVGVDGEGVTVHVYEMNSLPTYDYIVRSADETRGTVSVSDGTEQTEHHAGSSDTHYYEASSNEEKYNAGVITATPVDHKNTELRPGQTGYNQNKWLFDHWEQDGLPLDRNRYPMMIAADSLPIPYNGSNLVAYFKQNPNYVVPNSEKVPTSIEDMTEWMEGLQTTEIPLEPSATNKTAEVYDYENRIYRVDLATQANFRTFAGSLDMAFCLDVSNSMYFPSKLVETESATRSNPMPIYQINNGGWGWSNQGWLDTGRGWNNPYYLVADASGTATVFKVYYQDGNWKAQDASRETETDKSFVIGNDFKTNWTANQYDNQNNKNHPFGAGDNDNTTYMIYDAGDNGYNRFHYLNESLGSGSTDLNTIAGLLKVAGDASPNVKIAYNTFNGSLGNQRQDFQPAKTLSVNLAYASGGGTRPDQAFNDAQNFNWTASYTLDGNGELTETDRYVILVTDGAPQGGTAPSSGTVEDAVRRAAEDLKNNSHIKLITIGLSMENVTSGRRLLYDIADKDNNGEKMFYLAESASDLGDVFRQITKTLMEDVVVYGDITDTVGEAFYLVDKASGMPLGPDDMIDIEGNLTTDSDAAAGIVQPDGKTVKWLEQPIDSSNGWHGTVYVKAKEDLIGGNAVMTNADSDEEYAASFVATGYKVGNKPKINFVESSLLENLTLSTTKPSPKVNINELTFSETQTEWTVYLGTEVDPKEQLKKLYEAITVKEVINEDGSLHYDSAPNSISDDREGETVGTAVTFPLAPVILEHMINEGGEECAPYLTTDEDGNTVLNWETFLPAILDGGVTVPYHPYGIEGVDSNIVITLEKNVDFEGDDPIPSHETEVVGDAVETYTLIIKYNPDYDHVLPFGQGGKVHGADMHTGTYGSMYQGHAAGRETDTNNHVINVYNVPLDVYKTDGNDEALAGATFKLYKVDDENGEAVDELKSVHPDPENPDAEVPEDEHKYVEVASATSGIDGIARLQHEGEDFGLEPGVTYYLLESEAPLNYTKVRTVWAVQLQTEIGKYTDLEGEPLYSTITPPDSVGSGVTSDMYPFNWDQGARIMLNGDTPLLVIAKGETEGTTTEITNGSYVSHKEAVSFRHTVRNLLGGEIDLDLQKIWDDNNNPNRPTSVTVTLYRVSEMGHTWGEGKVVPCTCTDEGVEEYTCLVCGKVDTRVILATDHTPGAEHIENETVATCTEDGGYDTVVRCTVCNAVISTEHTSSDALGHDWGEWTVTTPARPGVAGEETRVCSRDPSHIQTHEIPALPNETTITYRTYRDWYGNAWLEENFTTTDKYLIGSTITLTWTSGNAYNATAYVNGTAAQIPDSYPQAFTLSGGTPVNVTRTQSGWNNNRTYTYTFTTTVTEGMTLDIKSNNWNYYPSNITITSNGTNSASQLFSQSLNPGASHMSAPRGQNGLSLMNVNAAPLLAGAQAASAVTDYLDAIGEKADATCAETVGAVHTYKEVAGTYTISGDSWTLNIPELPSHNKYGNPYTYYVVETPVPGYETTYSGQESGLAGDDNSLTIINKQKSVELTVNKNWVFAEPSRVTKVEGKEWPQNATVHVVVYSKIGDGDPTPTTYSVDLTADRQSYTFTGLPEYSGINKIDYVVVEAGVTGIDSTNFTSTISGNAESGYTITNAENPSSKTFSFTKIWRDAFGETKLSWPSGQSITVTIMQDSDEYAQYTIGADDLALGTEISANGADSADKSKLVVIAADSSTGYVFGLSDLPYGDTGAGYTYYAVEARVDGYQKPKYFEFNEETESPSAQQIGDRGTIYNDQNTYVLPETGGRGTLPFTLGGLAILLLAAALLFVLKGSRKRA